MTTSFLPLLLLAATPLPPQAAIPFVSSEGILDFRSQSETVVLIQANNGKWYRAETMNRCTGLIDALTIGFQTSALDQLDNHGALLVERRRCPILSLTLSAPPPPHARRAVSPRAGGSDLPRR